ncbi:MAG: EI24 domain-containing protein [Myxococcota bacterium]
MALAVKGAAKSVAKAPVKVAVGYWRGLTYPFRGAKFVYFKHPGLIRIWVFPILITLFTLIGVMWGIWNYHDLVVTSVWEEPTGEGFWSDVGRFFHGFIEVIVGILLSLIGIVLVFILSAAIAAPFNAALSEQVEMLSTGQEAPRFSVAVLFRDFFRMLGLELLKLAIYFMVMVPLWILQFAVPGVGSVLVTIFGYVFTSFHLAIDYTDHTPERRGLGFFQRYWLSLRRPMASLGFGTGCMVFFFIPFVNLLFLPAAVAGGTLMYLEMEESLGGVVEPTPLPPGESGVLENGLPRTHG